MIDQAQQDQYLLNVQPILEPLVQKILQYKPDDVVDYMLKYLQKIKDQREIQSLKQENEDADNDKNSKTSLQSSDDEEPVPQFIIPVKKRRNCLIPNSQSVNEQGDQLDDKDQIDFILKFMGKCFVFSNFNDKQKERLAKCFKVVKLDEFQNLYDYQALVNGLYLLYSGTLLTFSGEDKFHKELRVGDEYGLNSLLHHFNSPFKIWAGEKSVLLYLSSEQFTETNQQVMKELRLKQYENLREISIFKQLNDEQIHVLIDSIQRVYVQRNQFVFYQGDEGDGMYVIEEGYCIALIDNREVYKFKTKDYFGELALIEKGKRKTSILCKTNCVLMKISKETFNALFSNLVLNQNYDIQNN